MKTGIVTTGKYNLGKTCIDINMENEKDILQDAMIKLLETAEKEKIEKPEHLLNKARKQCRIDSYKKATKGAQVNESGQVRRFIEQEIIREVWRISGALNPRVWLGSSILSHNSNVRPGELVKVAEGDVMLDYGIVMVRYPKEGSLAQGKQARLWDEEIELIKSLPQALPDVPLFRHVKGESGVSPGQAFSRKIFNNWWKRACKNLGIDPDVTLYPGTKHSTMTAMSRVLSPEQVRKGGSRHASKAMDRYIIPSDRDGDLYQDTLRDIRSKGKKAEVVKIKKRKKK